MKASRDDQAGTPAKDGKQKKRNRIFARYMQKKLAFTFAVVALALFALAVVLLNIGRDNYDDYTKIVLAQQDYDSRTIAFRRGDILDRNGTVLATTTKLYNLILDPKVILSDSDKYLDTTVNALAECYGYDAGELRELILNNPESSYIIYEKEMTEDEMNQFLTLKSQIASENSAKEDSSESSKRVAGVWFETKYKRYYPQGDLACWVIGFSRDDSTVGSYGIEQYYNDELVGVNGREYGYLDDDTNLQRVVKQAQDGNTIVSTIDANIQSIIQRHIDEAQNGTDEEDGLSAYNIGVIAMDPNNGEILAMAGDAVFDLNDPTDSSALLGVYSNKYDSSYDAEHVLYTQEILDGMSDDEKLEAVTNDLWRNFTISYTYEPGSTAKVFTIAGALDEGAVTTNDTFVCDGYEIVGGWKIMCNNGHAHGTQTLMQTLMNSCNDALMSISQRLGRTDLARYQSLFNFGTKTGVDLPGEESGLVYSAENMDAATIATNAFGQNYNVTMLQQISAYCSIVNGGTYYEPHVVRQILNSDGAVIENESAVAVRQVVSADTSEFLKESLLAVVEEGTGSNAAIEGYDVWGKTGTAEKSGRDKSNYLVSFIGGVDIDNPQIVLYVVVDAPQGVSNQASSSYASTIWREIMEDLLPYLNIYPTGEVSSTEQSAPAESPATEPEEGEEGEEGGEDEDETLPETVIDTEEDYSGGIFVDPDAVPTQAEPEEEPQENPEEDGV